MLFSHRLAVAAATLALAAPGLAAADTYTLANFTGGVFGGNANAQLPGFTQGMSFGGTFVYDNDQVPAPGSGFDNVFESQYPDAAGITPAQTFTLNFGPLTFDASGVSPDDSFFGMAIQYNNGHFNGFFYVADFAYLGSDYQLDIQGGSVTVVPLVGGVPQFGQNKINGFINIGDGAVTGQSPFTPAATGGGCDPNAAACTGGPGVPEPTAWALMILGFGGVGAVLRRRRRSALAA
jgi:hypothetical protein